MSQKNLFVIAVLVDAILIVGLIAVLGSTLGGFLDDPEPSVVDTETPTLTAVPSDTSVPIETSSPTPMMMPIPTPTESPTLTPIPSPTRILPEEPTKAPYVFQTPVFIPPNMLDQPTRTPTRTRTR